MEILTIVIQNSFSISIIITWEQHLWYVYVLCGFWWEFLHSFVLYFLGGKRSKNYFQKSILLHSFQWGKSFNMSGFFNFWKSCLLIWRSLDINLKEATGRTVSIDTNECHSSHPPPPNVNERNQFYYIFRIWKPKPVDLHWPKIDSAPSPPTLLKKSSHVLLIVMITRPRTFYCPSRNIEPL